MNAATRAYHVLSQLGPEFAWRRAAMAFDRTFGITRRRFAPKPWAAIRLADILRDGVPAEVRDYVAHKRANPPQFLFPLGNLSKIHGETTESVAMGEPTLAERVALLERNRCVWFFHKPSPKPIDWYVNPFDGTRADASRTWCDIGDFEPAAGDTRMMWEPSRAAWAVDLARAKARGLEGATGELYWRWVESWMNACPPFRGFQWKCGQEASVRFASMAIGFWAFRNDEATTTARWAEFAKLAWATGFRVFHHIHYAVSQRNNHAISEACGLILISHLFPEFHESSRWAKTGRDVMSDAIRDQIYDDGSYVQHSMNYHRVMLQMSTLAMRVAELSGSPLEEDVYDRIGRSAEFLYQMTDGTTGQTPNYGHNDGSHVLPLTDCEFDDFRPAIQAAFFLSTRKKLLSSGPWDEELVTLFGDEALKAAEHGSEDPIRVFSRFETGGYYTLRGENSWAMVRCHAYRDRPSQCDSLHVDLWWKGLNILCDCGTYRYFVANRPDVERHYKSLAAHNTVVVDGAEPFEEVTRFLHVPWTKAEKRRFDDLGDTGAVFEGERHDYDRKPWHVLHRRCVLSLPGDIWVIVDDVLGDGRHEATVRWHLLDAPYEIDDESRRVSLNADEGKISLAVSSGEDDIRRFEVVRGRDDPGKVQGFASTHYGFADPIPVVEAEVSGSLPLRIVSAIAPGEDVVVSLRETTGSVERWGLTIAGREVLIDLESSSLLSKLVYVGIA